MQSVLLHPYSGGLYINPTKVHWHLYSQISSTRLQLSDFYVEVWFVNSYSYCIVPAKKWSEWRSVSAYKRHVTNKSLPYSFSLSKPLSTETSPPPQHTGWHLITIDISFLSCQSHDHPLSSQYVWTPQARQHNAGTLDTKAEAYVCLSDCS